MLFSRRTFLRTVACSGTAAAVGSPVLAASSAWFEATRLKEPDGPIYLNSNENPYGPSEKALAAMRSTLCTINRYACSYNALAEHIAKIHGVSGNEVILGCGSTEVLRVAATAFLGKGKQLIQARPTFEAMAYYAQAVGSEVVSVRLDSGFGHDLERMLQQARKNTGLVYICNPNNPTASITPRAELESFIRQLPRNTHVLIDEAYHHYAGQSARYASFIDRPLADDRVIVSRTFSAAYGLAGLRLGYAVGSPQALQCMRAYTTERGVNNVVTEAAMAALEDSENLSASVKVNADQRQEFRNQALARMLKPIDSHANFLMMDTHHPTEEVIQHFRQNEVLIGRLFPDVRTYIRVSLGTPEEMLKFWQVWDLLPYAHTQMSH